MIDAELLFGPLEPHRCCTCCDAYCPMTEAGDDWQPENALLSIETPAGECMTDRIIAVRRDLLGNPPSKLLEHHMAMDWPFPSSRPVSMDGHLHVEVMARLARAKVEPVATVDAAGKTMWLLFHEDEFAGWASAAHDPYSTSLKVSEWPGVRDLAVETGLSVIDALKVSRYIADRRLT